MPYLLGLFHWGACRLSKLGVKSKSKSCKMDQSLWEMHVMPSFVLYARVLTAHSLRRNCPKLRRSEWAVGIPTREFSHKRERAQTFISHTIRSILQVLIFGIALILLTLHVPQWDNPNKYGINGKANKQAF